MVVRIRVVEPRKLQRLDGKKLVRDIKKAMQDEAEQHRRMFAQATSTWSSANKPEFTRKTRDTGDEISVSLGTTSFPFSYIELGTDTRYMHMTSDFSPKSRPGSLRARKGAGGPLKLSWPKPGIKARNFSGAIVKKREKVLLAKLNSIIAKHVKLGS